MSGPVPSPSMKGIMGSSGTARRPFSSVIEVAICFRSGHLASAEIFRDTCGKARGKLAEVTALLRKLPRILPDCTIAGRRRFSARARSARRESACVRTCQDGDYTHVERSEFEHSLLNPPV